MKYLSVLIVLVSFQQALWAQPQKFTFSEELEKYPNEVFTVYGTNISDEDDLILDEFANSWKAGFLSDEEKLEIIKISNLLLGKKARGNPHFKSLMISLMAVKKSEKISQNYKDWIAGVNQILKTPKASLTAFLNYMKFTTQLAANSNIFETSTIVWKYSDSDISFQVDNAGIWVKFGKGNLTCFSRRDSIVIFDTEGMVNPIDNIWKGKTGKVTWERAGYTADQVHAVLNNYRIELKKSEFDADSVSFTHKQYFNQPIFGKLHNEVVPITTPEAADYPKFDSYNKRFIINKLYEGVDYDGGFSMRGAKIVGSGSETEDAIIKIVNNGKILMTVKSKFFVFRPDRVNGINTQANIRLETDSIFHADVTFVYYVNQKEINLLRTGDYSSRSMYSNTYHKLDMDFEMFSWKIDQPLINLTMARASTIGRARFQSQNFYNQAQFEAMQGMDDIHPLVALRKYSRSLGTDKFNAMGFAHYRNKNISEIRQILMQAAQEGFIFYNIQTDEVRLKKRLYDFLDSSTGKIDFDVVDLNSSTQAPTQNATLNMENYDITMNGIPRIFLSDSQNVVIYPTAEKIVLKRNRSFQFDGRIDAGLFTFLGSNFFFSYDEFKINLQNVDSVQIKLYSGELDNFGRPLTRNVQNVIEHITGDLVIDKADNKSGRYSNPTYPLFTSRENSYVYYNSPNIQNGVYPRENFFFELKPFVLDSLDNFKKEGMVFKGTFTSAGILPPLEQELYLQPDYSLGFKINSSKDGMPVYGGKGTLFADIQLSNDGLHAKGKLNHLTSTIQAEDYVFYPDSMNTFAQSFKMDQQKAEPEFPQVASNDNKIHWVPGKDEMNIMQKKDPFQMFNDKTRLLGNLKLKPVGLSGMGTMDLTTATLVSNEFKYKSNAFDADTASFNLRSLKSESFTVLARNVNSHVDFSSQKGEFTSNEDYTLVEFPENKYVSYLDHFNWDMGAKKLEMTAQKKHVEQTTSLASKFPYKFEEEPEGPRYISVNKNQDSLSFVSPVAVYDYEKNVINASEVKLMRVADAIIYTSDGKVTVEEGGIMRTLYKATVVTNYQTKYHKFKLAAVNVYGRNKYAGEGDYDFIDETERVQNLHFKEIKVDSALQTVAKAEVLETDKFTLSPYFDFQGKALLSANEKFLNFDGATHIKVDCGKIQPQWLAFESVIDPQRVMIPISYDPININRNKIYAGVLIANDSIHIYPAFLTKKRNYADIMISTADGYLIYDKDSSTYNIAQNEKLLDHNSPGNFLSLHREECVEYGEGKLNLGVDLGQLKLTAVGNVTHNIIPNITKLDLMLGMDFMIDPIALNLIANRIDSFPDLAGTSFGTKTYVRGMNEILGEQQSKAYHEEIKLYGFVKVYPPELTHTISFTQMKLTWDDESNSYYYLGKVGIGSIGTVQINRQVEAYVEIFKKRTGDIMDVYLKLDDKNWFYFGYTRGVMQMLSSSLTFIDIIKKLPNKVRQMDVTSGQTPYIYMVASDAKWINFKRQYQNRLKKLNMPEDNFPTAPPVSTPEEEIPEKEADQPNKEEVTPPKVDNKAPTEKAPDKNANQPANKQVTPPVVKDKPPVEEKPKEQEKEEEEIQEIK